jgi:hypothetical protein
VVTSGRKLTLSRRVFTSAQEFERAALRFERSPAARRRTPWRVIELAQYPRIHCIAGCSPIDASDPAAITSSSADTPRRSTLS